MIFAMQPVSSRGNVVVARVLVIRKHDYLVGSVAGITGRLVMSNAAVFSG